MKAMKQLGGNVGSAGFTLRMQALYGALRSVGAAFLFALVLLPSPALAAACIWFADANSINQVNTDDNSVVAEALLGDPRRLVMNDTDCGVWALRRTDRRLIKFDPSGTVIRDVNVAQLDPGLTEVLRVRLDPFDDSLWVTGDRRIAHLDADATSLIAAFSAPAEIRRFHIGLDQKLWVLGKRKLWRFNRQGKLIEERLLDTVLQGEARYFVMDELREAIWVAGDQQIARMSTQSAAAPTIVANIPEGITGFALDAVAGRVWFGRPSFLDALNPDGTPFTRVDLAALGLPGLHELAFDPASRSLWAGFAQQLVRFTDLGEPVAALPAVDYDDEALGMPPFKVRPRIVLERPPENGIVDRARPLFELEYRARCNGRACDVPPAYLSSLQLVSTLNGAAVGPGFEFNPDTNRASFRPATALPQGVSSFTARLTDVFGHKSNALDTTFTVDTIAPAFGPIAPAAGTVLPTPQVTLQGSINEPGTAVILQNAQALNPQGPIPQFPQPPSFPFSWDLTLLPGSNPIELSAVDRAGNVASTVHTLVFSGATSQAPQVAIQSPASGATIADDNVTVSGTWSGPPNTGITVNGIIAAIDGNRFYAKAPLQPGSNLLTTTATSPDGATATQGVTVTSTGAAPVRLVASSVQGIAPWNVSFSIVTGTGLTGIEADYNGDGIVDFTSTDPMAVLQYTYATPGTYQARFNVTDSQGNTHTLTQAIVVVSVASMDAMLRSTYSGMLTRLRAGDIDGALTAFTGSVNQKYRTVFTALGLSLPSIVDQLGAIQDGMISSGFAEYSIVRNLPNGQQAFLIYFIRGEDGVWRIDAM
jgi:PKD repeat protein